jgi:NADH-quinone oxidoreductase subunit H
MTPELKGLMLIWTVKIIAVFTVLNIGVMLVIWAERRVSGWIQDRLGPNRVGPEGILQSVADGLKNILKEETVPAEADRVLFFLAPAMSFVPALLLFAVIPFAAPMPIAFDFALPVLGRFTYDAVTPMIIADLPVGVLFIIAISSLGVYGVVLAGWSSASKYSLLGGLRASAQMISYEIALGLALVSVLVIAGNVTLTEVIARQQQGLWFVLPLTVGWVLFAISALAETNRLPFDLPEAEAELITGYHTEYSSMKFSMFFIAEYGAIITMSALMATLFFGGWDIPFTTWDEGEPSVLTSLATLLAFSLKTAFFVFGYIWVRWTLPRFRFDQLMALGWKFMLPGALAYIMLTAGASWTLDTLGVPYGPVYGWALFALNAVLLWGLLWRVDRGHTIQGVGYPAGRRV